MIVWHIGEVTSEVITSLSAIKLLTLDCCDLPASEVLTHDVAIPFMHHEDEPIASSLITISP